MLCEHSERGGRICLRIILKPVLHWPYKISRSSITGRILLLQIAEPSLRGSNFFYKTNRIYWGKFPSNYWAKMLLQLCQIFTINGHSVTIKWIESRTSFQWYLAFSTCRETAVPIVWQIPLPSASGTIDVLATGKTKHLALSRSIIA